MCEIEYGRTSLIGRLRYHGGGRRGGISSVQGTFIFPVPSRRSGLQKKRATFEVFDLQNTRFNYKIDPIIYFKEQALGGAVLTTRPSAICTSAIGHSLPRTRPLDPSVRMFNISVGTHFIHYSY